MVPRSKRQSAAPDQSLGSELRCTCGRLVARLVPGGVEVKCGRCKATVLVPLERDDTGLGPGERSGG